MSTEPRPEGWYWCRSEETWEIAHWNGQAWEAVGHIYTFEDNGWNTIDPTPIKRNENV